MQILIVRRDNIGDLVCTTPLFAALRRSFPNAWLAALVNSYNAPVLERNPDLDAVFTYTKLKHVEPGESALLALARRFRTVWALRRRRLDYALLATTDFVPRIARQTRWLRPDKLVGFSDGSALAAGILDVGIPVGAVTGEHEVRRVMRLAAALGAGSDAPRLTVVPNAEQVQEAEKALSALGTRRRIGIHISARRPAQRWPAQNFVRLIEGLHARHDAGVVLLWSPGRETARRHPGDDEKALSIAAAVGAKVPLIAYRTALLEQLIGALAACDAVVCSDGGAMHIAAALGKPIVAMFGDSPSERWHPWGVRHEILVPESRRVADLTVDQVTSAFARLPAH